MPGILHGFALVIRFSNDTLQGLDLCSNHMLCITFGAPPSSLSASPISFSTALDGMHSLFWNFLLADDNMVTGTSLLDIMPAVMSTFPKNLDVITSWLQAVTSVWTDSQSNARTAAEETTESLKQLTAAGLTCQSCSTQQTAASLIMFHNHKQMHTITQPQKTRLSWCVKLL